MDAGAAQLDEMRNVAYGLGMAFGQAAQVEGDLDRKLVLFDAFHRSFASVRLSIALALRLKREAHRPARVETERPETEPLEVEGAEATERAERYDERERDRDREAERASLPLLLRTLGRVADDAQALLPQAAELPTLRELLGRVGAQPAAEPPQPVAIPLRARLSGGTATLTLPPPHRPGGRPNGLTRRSTGPPRR